MATRKTKTQWLALFAEQENSGFSAAEFCRKHNLCEPYFYLKRKKLRSSSDKLSTFVAARPERKLLSGNAALRFGSCQLDVPTGADPQWLAQLMKFLS